MKSRQTVRPAPARPAGRRARLSGPELDALVSEATVDAYNDDEQLKGLSTLIEEHLAPPFTTEVLGMSGQKAEFARHLRPLRTTYKAKRSLLKLLEQTQWA